MFLQSGDCRYVDGSRGVGGVCGVCAMVVSGDAGCVVLSCQRYKYVH